MSRFNALFPLFIVAILAGASFWLENLVRTERTHMFGRDRHDPDAIIENFEVQRFGLDGAPQLTLSAARAVHFPDDDSSELEKPRLQFNDPARRMDWSAEHAVVTDNSRRVDLTGKVIGVREATAETPMQALRTERLTVFTEDEVAQTDAPVSLTQGATRVDGTGGRWDNINGLITLNRVRARLHSDSR